MKKETLEEAAKIKYPDNWSKSKDFEDPLLIIGCSRSAFITGAKWMQERMYSKEDMKKAFIAGGNSCIQDGDDDDYGTKYTNYMNKWFEQYKKNKL